MATDSLPRFRGRLDKMQDRISKALPIAVMRANEPIRDRAKQLLVQNQHLQSRALHDSIIVQLESASDSEAMSTVGTDELHGKFVEALDDGGFLYRASEERKAEAIRRASETLDEAIKQGAK